MWSISHEYRVTHITDVRFVGICPVEIVRPPLYSYCYKDKERKVGQYNDYTTI
jgi:hypothetical protein